MTMIAASGIVEVVKSEKVERIANKSVTVLEKWLDKQLKENVKNEK